MTILTRRQFVASTGALLGAPRLLSAAAPAIESIKPIGPFLADCTLAG